MTQTPKDVPAEVLAQLGNRVQHALRAFTPDDAKALKATVGTFPASEVYDLTELLTSMGIGEAAVTILSERGAPTPVAWTMLRPPSSSMAPLDPAVMVEQVAASPLAAEYATAVDRESAYELLLARVAPDPEPAGQPAPQEVPYDEPEQDRAARARWPPCSAPASSAASRGPRRARPGARSAARCSAPRRGAAAPPAGAEPPRPARRCLTTCCLLSMHTR